ncbi:MAG: hypothetical protein ACYCYI_11540 [Saccharofermentanales bacterium]
MQRLISELIRRGELSAQTLLSKITPEGYLYDGDDDLGNYYKCLYPVRLTGHTATASLLANRIMEMFYQENHDLHNKTGPKTGGNYTSNYCQFYPNYWVMLGSALCGRYDITMKLVDSAKKLYYNEKTGSFCSNIDQEDKTYDTNSAAIAIETFCLSGEYDKADRAADFLSTIEKNQPDPDNFFYSRANEDFEILTDPTNNPVYTLIDKNQPFQAYWFLGMPALALARFYDKTGNDKYLKLSQLYYEQFISCGDFRTRALGSGKNMSAAAILYRQTKDIKYFTDCKNIAEFFFSLQSDTGVFVPPGSSLESITPKVFYDIVPEYTRWLFEVASDLSAMV